MRKLLDYFRAPKPLDPNRFMAPEMDEKTLNALIDDLDSKVKSYEWDINYHSGAVKKSIILLQATTELLNQLKKGEVK